MLGSIPQGSILRPLVFSVYVYCSVYGSESGSFISYADDTTVFLTGESKEETEVQDNQVVSDVITRMGAKFLRITVKKVLFTLTKNSHDQFLLPWLRPNRHHGNNKFTRTVFVSNFK